MKNSLKKTILSLACHFKSLTVRQKVLVSCGRFTISNIAKLEKASFFFTFRFTLFSFLLAPDTDNIFELMFSCYSFFCCGAFTTLNVSIIFVYIFQLRKYLFLELYSLISIPFSVFSITTSIACEVGKTTI